MAAQKGIISRASSTAFHSRSSAPRVLGGQTNNWLCSYVPTGMSRHADLNIGPNEASHVTPLGKGKEPQDVAFKCLLSRAEGAPSRPAAHPKALDGVRLRPGR